MKIPTKYDDGWTKFALEQIQDKKDGNPTCQGLLSFCEKYYGKVLGTNTEVVKAPTQEDRSATVTAAVSIMEWVRSENEDGDTEFDCNQEGFSLVFTGSADANADFLPEPFNIHLVSSLETRALSKALKRAMNLDCYSAEEMTYTDKNFDAISDQKRSVISLMLEDLDIDKEKFMLKYAGVTPDQLGGLSQKVGISLLETLNVFDQQGVPEELKNAS